MLVSLTFTGLHGVIFQKIDLFMTTAIRNLYAALFHLVPLELILLKIYSPVVSKKAFKPQEFIYCLITAATVQASRIHLLSDYYCDSTSLKNPFTV
jgi:hypothetical protein